MTGGEGPHARFGEPLAGDLPASPAAERNKEPILEVLRRVLPAQGVVLEIASGTGQHALHFAPALSHLDWQPSDADPGLVEAIGRRRAAQPLPNLREPLELDVLRQPWPATQAAAVVCINLIHIAPWSAAVALFRGAASVLPAGAPLVLYGPYRRGGRHTAASNAAFDASLRARDREWGVRDLDAVAALAASHGFALTEVAEMPANNLTVVFIRRELETL